MDEKMHFDICKNIYIRHWDYGNGKESAEVPHQAADVLFETIRKFGDVLVKAFPPVRRRDEWLSDVAGTLELLNMVSPSGNYIEVKKPNQGDEGFRFNWAEEVHILSKEEEKERNKTVRFFRSYADGLEGK